ncbi:MAG: ornithine cyclodeaminase family protein [Desulfobacterales bacterium]|nr:ornithine cyclodeaminase family protein [Desulfobacterales bacterium]
MPLVLTDSEISGLVSMEDYIRAMEKAFFEYGNGTAAIRPRQRYQVPLGGDRFHMTNIIGGAVPGFGVSAVRLNSWPRQKTGQQDKPAVTVTGGWGMIVLFDLETGKLLGLLMDGIISDLRVGATTGMAIKRLAREDACSIGVLGTGRQARSNLEAICLVRKIQRVKVYSPNADHRARFADEMKARLNIPVVPVDSSSECVKDMDIIGCFTNSDVPVFDGDLIRAGQTIVSIRNTDHVNRSDEVDQKTFLKSDRIAISDRATLLDNKQGELLNLIHDGKISWENVVELKDLIAGRARGRVNDRQVVYFKNNTGMGIQFAAAGKIVLAAARKKGLGTEIPDELFTRAR